MRYNEVYFSQQSELGDSPDSSSVYPRPQQKVGSNSQRVQMGQYWGLQLLGWSDIHGHRTCFARN